jgi:hypothetical protein
MVRGTSWAIGLLLLFSLEAVASSTLQAAAWEGERTVYAELAEGEPIAIGTIAFTDDGDRLAYRFDLEESVLSERFLSMRPFKCLELNRQTICHLPYPYDLTGSVQPPDWRDLEYRLLFLFKDAGDYGINFENGYYFRFEQDGERLIGSRFETNMDQLASPPPDDIRYPLEESELYESEGSSHQLLRLVIE